MTGIYKITNKLNGMSYIGQSVNIAKRWKTHCNGNSTSLIHKAIFLYGKDNFSFEVLEECKKEELNDRERYWIHFYDTYNNGYNLTLGGGQGISPIDKDAIYEDYLRTNNMATTAKNCKCHVSSVREVLHELNINHKEMQENKPVEAIDPTTLKVVKKYQTIQDAADDMGISRAGISMALSGVHKSAGGYFWKQQNEEKVFTATTLKPWKVKVQQIDCDTGKILAEFESAAEAASSLGKDRKNGSSQITAVCNGRKKTAYGYKWKKIV